MPEDRSATVGFDNRIDARIKPRADKGFYASKGEFLVFGVRKMRSPWSQSCR